MDSTTRELEVRARWVCPVHRPPLRDALVRIRGEAITYVGPAADAPAVPPEGRAPRDVMDLGNAALLPGLVNVHSHLELTALRGLCEEDGFFDWIRGLVAWKRDRRLEEALRVSTEWGVAEALRGGVTTVADTRDRGPVLETLRSAGMRGRVYQEVFGLEPGALAPALASLEEEVARLGSLCGPRLSVGVSPHAPYTVGPDLLARLRVLALERGLPLAIHAAESADEEDLLLRGAGPFARLLAGRGIAWTPPGGSTIAYLDALGVLEARPLLIHAVRLSEEDLDRVAASGSAVAHCPRSNAKLGHGVAPLEGMLERGIRVGLGTDGAVASNSCDLIEEARLAALLQRARPGREAERAARRRLLPAAEALRLLTLGGAEALGLEGSIGTLEPGKQADLAAVSLEGPGVFPSDEPEGAVVFACGRRDVVLTMVAGRVLYRDGRLFGIDEERLREELREARRGLGQGHG